MRKHLLIILIFFISIPAHAASYFKCHASVAHIGDTKEEVEATFGSPDYSSEERKTCSGGGYTSYYYICDDFLWHLKFYKNKLAGIIKIGPERNCRDYLEERFGEE